MLIEAWERLHGYRNWTPVAAKVRSVAVTDAGIGMAGNSKDAPARSLALQTDCVIVWQDQHGAEHEVQFTAFEESPLYQLSEGETVNIRVNPARPAEFYLPGLAVSSLVRAWRAALFALLFVLVFIAFIVAWFGPSLAGLFSR
jgi:hypothetical protein